MCLEFRNMSHNYSTLRTKGKTLSFFNLLPSTFHQPLIHVSILNRDLFSAWPRETRKAPEGKLKQASNQGATIQKQNF